MCSAKYADDRPRACLFGFHQGKVNSSGMALRKLSFSVELS